MIQGVVALLFLVLAFNAYRDARRRGIWSWPQFFLVVGLILAVPVVIVLPLTRPRVEAWASQHAGAVTIVIVMIIFVLVGGLAYAFRRKAPR